MEKINIDLEKLERKNVFTTPDGYFETLPLIIQKRIAERSNSQSWFSIGWVRYGVSVSLLMLVISSGYWFYQQQTSSIQTNVALSELSDIEIVEYLKQTSVSQEELVDIATKENVEIQNFLFQETDEKKILEELDQTLSEEPM